MKKVASVMIFFYKKSMDKKKNQPKNRKIRKTMDSKNRAVTFEDLNFIEFHRHVLALMPNPDDQWPGIAYLIKEGDDPLASHYCTCATARAKMCPHLQKLWKIHGFIKDNLNPESFYKDFRKSIWYRLGSVMAEADSLPIGNVQIREIRRDDHILLQGLNPEGEEIFCYLSRGPDRLRFLERFTVVPDGNAVPQRGTVLAHLSTMALSEEERMMQERGFRTGRRAFEESYWHRLVYHAYREIGTSGFALHPSIDKGAGTFMVTCLLQDKGPFLRMAVPRTHVRRLLSDFKAYLPNQHDLSISPIPLKTIFNVTMNTELDLEVRPLIRMIQENGEEAFFKQEDLEKFTYGDLVYVKDLGILAELERSGKERRFKAPVKMVLKKSQIPTFLDEYGDEIREGTHLVDEGVQTLRIYKKPRSVEISLDALDREWWWMSVSYGFGNATISLSELLDAQKEGQRYIGRPGGWIDCQSPDISGLEIMLQRATETRGTQKDTWFRLSALDLIRMKAAIDVPFSITGDGDNAGHLKRLMDLEPGKPLPALKGMTSPLRTYQTRGVEWIRFLFENGFGGILCDDMGLGKTHQVMAFMLFLIEYGPAEGPFLVVCPTTVLSHWSNKMREHAPGLKCAVYHGGERNLKDSLSDALVLLTSYGILRRDIEQLGTIPFSLAVFDEIQHIKNPDTLGHKAAGEVRARMKLGLTGTPIENTLFELKALLDLTLPGYLGSDTAFLDRYVRPIEDLKDSSRQRELRRLISPFTMRRRKETVLSELPAKIEDLRTCRLSDDQIKLYRDAISSKGTGLIRMLQGEEKSIPYIHIFALLNLLKQICNHPVMIAGSVDDYESWESGKWDLFKELLDESLDSGQKLVVYSQFLKTLRIMELHLEKLRINFVKLTGQSKDRGKMIDRFNHDPDCRVFLGSLKAGGTGIDLVAGSVVIHYDRWWNAAKEDQATDRVHRIGQKRGVQVFKLVTEGTLEEKISAIIEKKRHLMAKIVQEDDPGLLKSFSREDLIELLADPASD